MSIFTKIINREIPANIVYEDDLVLAFLDISQVTKGHTLVIPKKPYKDIFELDDEISGHLYSVVVKLSKAIKKAFQADGLNIINNNRAAAGQVVFHYHIHIVPRYEGDDFKINWVDHGKEYSGDDFKNIRDEIIKAIS